MDNKSIAKALEEIGVMIELTGGNPFKARAHYTAARITEGLMEPVASLIETGRLSAVRGFGSAMVEKVTELVHTGRIKEYDEFKASIPSGLFDMLRIPGMGPRKVRAVHEKLNLSTLGELEYACRENRLVTLEGFGAKSQDNILTGIEQFHRYRERQLLPRAQEEARALLEELRTLPHVTRAHIAGSIRRHRETVKDIDILASVAGKHRGGVMDYFTSLPQVEKVTGKGGTKSSVLLAAGFSADLRLVTEREYPFALHHFTGSKEHNTAMRSRAKKLNLKMNEYGLFPDAGAESLECASEREIFEALGLACIEPELRENNGEIEAAEDNRLPRLVTGADIRGILHVHTQYSDGKNSIEEMVRACIESGYEYLGISDHSRSAYYANGLSEERIRDQHEEIDRVQAAYPDFRIFKGIEADILSDGSLDYPDEVLSRFDFVIASVHSKMKMSESEATSRIERAVRNPYTTMLGHPTGRLLLGREGYPLDWERIFSAAKECGCVIELNANPWRFDLDWRLCKRAKEFGLKIAVNPDAHSTDMIQDVLFGVGIARKGWLEAADIICTMGARELDTFFKNHRQRSAG